ncbi:MAG: mechanosensitive ion channel family protein, partial [Betaproteobacteria bacterium]|nr:mechanosensitive ion channel family protein [Betaproteobacteria bacterium]
MKMLRAAWQGNDLETWITALTIAATVFVVIAVARFVIVRVTSALARRTAWPLSEVLGEVARATRLWLLAPIALVAGASALELPAKLERLLDNLAVIGLMVQVAVWVNRFVQNWLKRRIEAQRGVDGQSVTVLTLLGFAARVVVWALTLLLVLGHLGFDITALVTGLGIGGIAIALAVQNILGDLFA